MGLIFLILGLTALLVSDYSTIFRRAAPRERLLEVIELGLERVCSEVGAALLVTTPSSGTASSLAFDRLNPAAVGRLPNPLPATPAASWNHYDPDHILTVDYLLESQVLVRRVTSDTSTSRQEICDGVAGLSATLVTPRSLRIAMSVDVNGTIQTVTREAILWIDR